MPGRTSVINFELTYAELPSNCEYTSMALLGAHEQSVPDVLSIPFLEELVPAHEPAAPAGDAALRFRNWEAFLSHPAIVRFALLSDPGRGKQYASSGQTRVPPALIAASLEGE